MREFGWNVGLGRLACFGVIDESSRQISANMQIPEEKRRVELSQWEAWIREASKDSTGTPRDPRFQRNVPRYGPPAVAYLARGVRPVGVLRSQDLDVHSAEVLQAKLLEYAPDSAKRDVRSVSAMP